MSTSREGADSFRLEGDFGGQVCGRTKWRPFPSVVSCGRVWRRDAQNQGIGCGWDGVWINPSSPNFVKYIETDHQPVFLLFVCCRSGHCCLPVRWKAQDRDCFITVVPVLCKVCAGPMFVTISHAQSMTQVLYVQLCNLSSLFLFFFLVNLWPFWRCYTCFELLSQCSVVVCFAWCSLVSLARV